MPTDKTLSNLVINRIPTQEIYNILKEQNLINEDELYMVEEDDSGSGEIITYDVATPTSNGLMSATDKAKLDEIEAQANKYVHPSYTSKSKGFYKVTVDAQGHVSSTTTVTKTDITNLGIPAQDTTYGVATESADGLMSKTDKAKLNSIIQSEEWTFTLEDGSTVTKKVVLG